MGDIVQDKLHSGDKRVSVGEGREREVRVRSTLFSVKV